MSSPVVTVTLNPTVDKTFSVDGVAAGVAAVMSPGTELGGREDTERLYQHRE